MERPEDNGIIHDIFYRNYDHLDHGANEIEQDINRIKVLEVKDKRKKGRKCQPLDWVAAHYKTWDTDTNHKLEDSRKFKRKQPAVFQIGTYGSLKCWEITTAYMHAGQVLKVKCPAYLAYGGTAKYGHFGLDVIPKDSDLVFELEVLECADSIEKFNEINKQAKNRAPWVCKANGEGPCEKFEELYPAKPEK